MLEIKNLTKIYHPKGGAEVRALDDVSVRFAEKGMVFLLGKSGSGKSTLLNLCGGLDAPDGGEIIIKGKSSKAFSQSDFDSYRNTFVGFVFQEYNILDEFSVEENIALALELQGKNKDRKKVAEILEKVDLANFFSAGDSLEMVNSMVTILEQVFLWVGVTFAVFSMLLMFNFISVSIAQKKKEIGILRAVGARSADVFKIFYAESAIITLICMVLSIVAGFVICSVLNNRIGTDLGASIFVFGPMSVLMIVGISILTSLIATFLPVYNIARKKPVESIRSL